MSILGTWKLTVKSPMGEQASTLTLNEDGTGETSSQMGSSPINNVEVDGNSATFTVKIKAMGQEFELNASAVAELDSISGTYSSATSDSAFTGQRVT